RNNDEIKGTFTLSQKQPNIVFIMSDDHAAHAMSCYGSRINETPNLDRIANEGMRFDNCFCTNSICAPSRAAILTGQYNHENGVNNDTTGFDYWNVLPGQGEYHQPSMYEMGNEKKYDGYVTDIITDLSIDWIKQRNKEQPFMLMCHHKAPHRPWEPDEKHANLY